MGFARQVDRSDGSVFIASIELSTLEAKQYANYVALIEKNSSTLDEIRDSKSVLAMTLGSSIPIPVVRIVYSSDVDTKLSSLLEKKLTGLRVETEIGPVTRELRDRVWNEIRAELLNRDFKSSVIQTNPDFAESAIDLVERSVAGRVVDAQLGIGDWRPILIIDGDDIDKATLALRGLSWLSSPNGTSLVSLRIGKERVKMLPAPPRPSNADNPRGGKAISDGVADFCTMGPTVQESGVVSVITAGHCLGVGNAPILGNTQGQTVISCDRCVPNNGSGPNVWWGIGVDVALVRFPQSSAGYPNGWDGPAWYIWQDFNNQPYYDRQLGSTDPYAGQHYVCIEGASRFKLPANGGGGQFTSCGISAGVSYDDFRLIAMYPGHPVCGGDSGALVRIPSPPNGSFVTGILSATGGGAPTYQQQCRVSLADGSNFQTAYISSFWKIHQYLSVYHGIDAWVRSW
jgi:hypothetical protein